MKRKMIPSQIGKAILKGKYREVLTQPLSETEMTKEMHRRRVITELNAALAEQLGDPFPLSAQVKRIWNGKATLFVLGPVPESQCRALAADILRIIKDAGISSIRTLHYEIEDPDTAVLAQDERLIEVLPAEERESTAEEDDGAVCRSLFVRAGKLKRLNAHLATQLGSPFPHNAFVTSVKQGVVSIVVSNGSISTQLRYQRNSLLEQLRVFGIPDILNVRVTVSPDMHTYVPHKEPRPARRPQDPATVQQSFNDAASGIHDDGLAEALKRLGKSVSKKPS